MVRKYLIYIVLLWGSLLGAQQFEVSHVKIEGIKRIREDFILKLVAIKAGMPLDSSVINRDIQRLKSLPSVSHTAFTVVSMVDNSYEVVYNIIENHTLLPYVNVFTSNNDEIAFILGLQEFNFLGRNITLGGFYQYDVFNSFGLHFRAPFIFGPKLGLAIGYKNLTTQEPVFFSNTTASYKYNNNGFEVMGLYSFNIKNRIELGFGLFTEDYKYLSGAISDMVPQALHVDKHLIKLLYHFENITYHFQYLSGFRSSLNVQYVNSESVDLPSFLIGFNDFINYRRIGQSGNWATRLRLGIASNMDTPFAPFAVDNNLNIRGVGNTIDRGTAAIVLNTEYRHTFIDRKWFVLQGNAFIDGGTWRNPGGTLKDLGSDENIRVYPGFGLRFIHKRIFNAILRIDYGFGITKNASQGIVFGIGQYF